MNDWRQVALRLQHSNFDTRSRPYQFPPNLDKRFKGIPNGSTKSDTNIWCSKKIMLQEGSFDVPEYE